MVCLILIIEGSTQCRSPMFTCRNLKCILPVWILDGNDDCGDGTDEGEMEIVMESIEVHSGPGSDGEQDRVQNLKGCRIGSRVGWGAGSGSGSDGVQGRVQGRMGCRIGSRVGWDA